MNKKDYVLTPVKPEVIEYDEENDGGVIPVREKLMEEKETLKERMKRQKEELRGSKKVKR